MSETAVLKFRLDSDGKGLATGISKATAQIRGLYGAIAGGAAVAFAKRIIDTGSAIVDLSQKTGIATDTLQAWQYAAELSGATIEDVSNAFKHLQKSIVEALGPGGGSALKDFERFGVTLKDLQTTNPEAIFNRIAASVQKTGVNANVTTSILGLMGKSADNLIPAMVNGFSDAARAAEKLGLIMSPETLARLDEAGDKITTLARRLVTVLAPAIAYTLGKMGKIFDGLDMFVGYTGTYFGAISGGATEEEAKRVAAEFVRRKVSDQKEAEKALEESINRLGKPGVMPPATVVAPFGKSKPEGATHVPTFSGASPIAADSLARIGLFRGGSEATRVSQILTTQVNRLESAVSELRGIRAALSEE